MDVTAKYELIGLMAYPILSATVYRLKCRIKP